MSKHHGSCHCGAVQVILREAPADAGDCNCSLCRRIGGLWHHCALSQVTVTGAQTGYVQGDSTLTTWHCPICGCTTHWTPLISTTTGRGSICGCSIRRCGPTCPGG